jgi:sulfoxide reductase catalytic subunit YedY
MLIRKTHLSGESIPSSQITPQEVFERPRMDRRRFLARSGALATGASLAGMLPADAFADDTKLTTIPGKFQATDPQTPFSKATTYNNFYEFGTSKDEPAKNAHTLQTRPWTIKVDGLVKKPLTVNIDDLLKYRPLESRVYRHRCVEAWSMVIPWDGYSLSEFINFCEPLPSAKYVQFISNVNGKQMPQLPTEYNWPYTEGLRMDEAMHPLTLLTFGCYGQVLPNQNGAPVRVVLPWKWGYKSAKSIVRLKFTKDEPSTLWNQIEPTEYGFYSNVNPNGGHRIPQQTERRLDGGFPHTLQTQMFNGYGDQVASLYAGMDLNRYY